MVLFSWTQGTPTICQQLPQSASIAYAEAIGTWFVWSLSFQSIVTLDVTKKKQLKWKAAFSYFLKTRATKKRYCRNEDPENRRTWPNESSCMSRLSLLTPRIGILYPSQSLGSFNTSLNWLSYLALSSFFIPTPQQVGLKAQIENLPGKMKKPAHGSTPSILPNHATIQQGPFSWYTHFKSKNTCNRFPWPTKILAPHPQPPTLSQSKMPSLAARSPGPSCNSVAFRSATWTREAEAFVRHELPPRVG